MNEKTNDWEQPIENQTLIADAKQNELNQLKNETVNDFDDKNGSLGKFKNTDSLLNAYNNLQAEFTRKCQKLKELEKTNEIRSDENIEKNKRLENFVQTENSQTENSQTENSQTENLQAENFEQAENNELPEQEKNNFDNQVNQNNFNENIKNFVQAKNPQNENLQAKNLQAENAGQTESSEQSGKANQIVNESQTEQPVKKVENIGQAEVIYENPVQKNQFQNELIKDDEFIKNFIFSHSDIKEEILKSYLEEVQKTKSPKVILSSVGCGIPIATPLQPSNLEEAKEIIKKMFD